MNKIFKAPCSCLAFKNRHVSYLYVLTVNKVDYMEHNCLGHSFNINVHLPVAGLGIESLSSLSLSRDDNLCACVAPVRRGFRFFCKPKEGGADHGSDVCDREQTVVSQATPFAVRVWLARLSSMIRACS